MKKCPYCLYNVTDVKWIERNRCPCCGTDLGDSGITDETSVIEEFPDAFSDVPPSLVDTKAHKEYTLDEALGKMAENTVDAIKQSKHDYHMQAALVLLAVFLLLFILVPCLPLKLGG